MINITEDIHSLTEFKKHTNEFIGDLKKTGRPTVLTVNGKAEIVVMDAATFQKIQEHIKIEEGVLEIARSLKDFESGKFSTAENVFGDLKKKITKSQKNPTEQKNNDDKTL